MKKIFHFLFFAILTVNEAAAIQIGGTIHLKGRKGHCFKRGEGCDIDLTLEVEIPIRLFARNGTVSNSPGIIKFLNIVVDNPKEIDFSDRDGEGYDLKGDDGNLYRVVFGNDKGRFNGKTRTLEIIFKNVLQLKKVQDKQSLRGTTFEEKKDFVWNDATLMKVLGYESLTFRKGVYEISNDGTITLNILSSGKPLNKPSDNLIIVSNSTVKEYRGPDCFLFGMSCCVYLKEPDKSAPVVDYRFVLKEGKPVSLTIFFRGAGSPKSQGF